MGANMPDLFSLFYFAEKEQLYFSRTGMRGETLYYLDNSDTVRSTSYILPMAKSMSLLPENKNMVLYLDILDSREERSLLRFNLESGLRYCF